MTKKLINQHQSPEQLCWTTFEKIIKTIRTKNIRFHIYITSSKSERFTKIERLARIQMLNRKIIEAYEKKYSERP